MRFSAYRNAPSKPLLTYSDCADEFIEQAELRFPIYRKCLHNEWALERYDVLLVFVYFAACRAVEPACGEQLFAGRTAGTPHVRELGFPRGYWDYLGRRGLRLALQTLPELGVPSLHQTRQQVRSRFDHAHA